MTGCGAGFSPNILPGICAKVIGLRSPVPIKDGSMITAYEKSQAGQTVLVRWHPDARPLTPNAKLPDDQPFILRGGAFGLR